MKVLAFIFALFMPLMLFAQDVASKLPVISEEPDSLLEGFQAMKIVWELVQNGQYLLASAALVLVLVFAIKRWALPKLKLGTGVLPILSGVLGILVAIALSILGGATVQQAALAMLAGPAASHLWDSVGKYFFKK